uniref:Uncharacterized protein n=1 Tax=Wuchereria bancrofti TaxID=6293 RepID=A0A1I8EKR0_WUCBA
MSYGFCWCYFWAPAFHYFREPTIGRSYRLNGSDDYETPRMSRLPLNYYRRKWAYEKARKSESLCNSYFTTVTL